MRNSDNLPDDDALDALFAAARSAAPVPSAALMARLQHVALAEQPRAGVRQTAPSRARGGLLAQLFDNIGGWPALAGLATAGVAGLWIGLNPPQPLSALFGATDLTVFAPYDLTLLDEEG